MVRLLTAAGFRVAGRDPIATFLTQVGRANEVESVRPRSGLYRRLLEREAVANIVARFCTADRSQAMMACGRANTLVGLLIAEATESTRTLVLVPSPSLLAQTLREWTANAKRAFCYLAVCPDETAVGEDAVVSTTSELPEHGRDDAVPSQTRHRRGGRHRRSRDVGCGGGTV